MALSSNRMRIPVDLLGLILRLKTRPTHRVNALCIQRMPYAEVSLSNLLALRVFFDRPVVVAKLLMLLTKTQVGHDSDCNKIVQLEVEAFDLGVRAVDRLALAFVLDLFS